MRIKESIEELRLNSKFEKSKHFNAANRKKSHIYWLGIPVIIISIFLGSAVFTQYLDNGIGKIIGAVLAFLSALLVSLQTFMNPKDSEEGHRSIGNRYIAVSRKCAHLLAKLEDELLTLEETNNFYEVYLEEYLAINREAESFPTDKKDFEHAKAMAISKVT